MRANPRRPPSGRTSRLLASSLALSALTGCATGASDRADDSGEGRDATAKRELVEITSFRASGHVEAALAGLDRLLKQIGAWGGVTALSAGTRASFDTELAGARTFVSELGAQEASSGRPLAAEAELARLAPLLADPELEASRAEALARDRKAGQETCARLQATVANDTPHWGLAVSRYCAHFGVTFAAPAPTGTPSALALDGSLTGLTAPQNAALRARIEDWAKASFWFDPRGTTTARGKVEGTLETSFQHRTVTLHAPYEDTITSHTNEGTKAVEENPLTQLLVPQSTSSTTMDRTFNYDAEESRGHYGLDAKVSLELGTAQPVSFSLRHVDDIKAYDHDVTFEKAGIVPVHAHVPTSADWLDGQLDRMAAKVVAALNRRFLAVHCARETYALEDAAGCLAAGQRQPAAVEVVTRSLGDDLERTLPFLRPPAPPAAPTPARKPPPRAPTGDAAETVID